MSAESTAYGPAGLPFHSIALNLEGNGTWEVRSGHREYTFNAGSVCIAPRGFEIESSGYFGTAGLSVGVQLPSDLLAQYLEEDADRFNVGVSIGGTDSRVVWLLSAIRNELDTGCCAGALYAQGLTMALIGHLQTRFQGSSSVAPNPGILSKRSLARVVEYMDANLASDIAVADLAAVAHLSPTYFARAFKSTTGSSPYRFLQQRRIERALSLVKGSQPLAEIALSVGMGSQSHFTQVFRQHVGVSPGRLRAAAKR